MTTQILPFYTLTETWDYFLATMDESNLKYLFC